MRSASKNLVLAPQTKLKQEPLHANIKSEANRNTQLDEISDEESRQEQHIAVPPVKKLRQEERQEPLSVSLAKLMRKLEAGRMPVPQQKNPQKIGEIGQEVVYLTTGDEAYIVKGDTSRGVACVSEAERVLYEELGLEFRVFHTRRVQEESEGDGSQEA